MAGPTRTETTLSISSPAFDHEREIPAKYTCDGEDVSPALRVSGVPGDAKSLVILMDDPDAPGGTFDHWVAWNLPADIREVPEGVDVPHLGGKEGQNGFGRTGYGGPCPPAGPAHRYFIRIYALNSPLELDPGVARGTVDEAVREKAVAHGELMGTYKRG